MKNFPINFLPTYIIWIIIIFFINLDIKAQEFQIIQFLNTNNQEQIILINAGKKDGIKPGTLLKTYRPTKVYNTKLISESILIETGLIKILQVNENNSIAQVIKNGTELSKSVFTKYPNIMVGDITKEANFIISPNKILTPTITLYYKDIFIDPNKTPTTFELSEKGKNILQKELQVFADKKISALIIEGHTDLDSDTQRSQVESYQRALIIKQFMVNNLLFNENALIPIGFGDQQPLYSNFISEDKILNRRIVIKALNIN